MTDSQQELDLTFDDVPTNTADCREPGIHRDVPFEEYASWKAINSGVLRWGKVSMKHMKAALDGLVKSEDTKDRKLGRAIHQRVLEPDRPLVVATQCAAMKKDGTRCSNLGYLTCSIPGDA